MAPSSRTTASWARSPGAATQWRDPAGAAFTIACSYCSAGWRHFRAISAGAASSRAACGVRGSKHRVRLRHPVAAGIGGGVARSFYFCSSCGPSCQAPDLQAAMASALQGLAPSPPIGAAPSVVPDDELLPPEGFELPPFCSASQGGKGARNDAPSLRAGRPLTELTAGQPSAHIDQWRVRLDGIAREVRDFMSQTGLSHWRVSPQSSVPADPLPSL